MRWTSGLAAKVCMSSSDQILICLGCITSLWRPELISLRFLLVRLVAELWVTLRGLHTRLGAWVFSLQRGDRVRERERESATVLRQRTRVRWPLLRSIRETRSISQEFRHPPACASVPWRHCNPNIVLVQQGFWAGLAIPGTWSGDYESVISEYPSISLASQPCCR